MVFDGNMAWPPTRTGGSDMVWANTGAVDAIRITANRAMRFIWVSPLLDAAITGRCPLSLREAGSDAGARGFFRRLLKAARCSRHAANGVPGWSARRAGVLRHAEPRIAVRAAARLAALAVPARRRSSGCVLHPQRAGDRAVVGQLRLPASAVPDRPRDT